MAVGMAAAGCRPAAAAIAKKSIKKTLIRPPSDMYPLPLDWASGPTELRCRAVCDPCPRQKRPQCFAGQVPMNTGGDEELFCFFCLFGKKAFSPVA
jgi:hypothetical protein